MADVPGFRELLKEDARTPEALANKAVAKLKKGAPIAYVRQENQWVLYEAATRLSQRRAERYRDYDLMEDDALMASALELMTDDACQMNRERGGSMWAAPGSDTEFIQRMIEEHDMENRLWGWIYNVAKYGDFFLGIGERKGKFIGLEEAVHPKDVKRIDIDGVLTAFAMSDGKSFSLTHPWRYVHFINNYKPTFEKTKIRLHKSSMDANPDERTVTARYGTSVLEAARKIFKILQLLEQSLALARLSRAPLLRVFYVNTEGLTPTERDETLEQLERRFKEQMSFDLRTNLYRADFKPLSYNCDIFIPYSGGKGDVRAETLGGEMNIKDIVDIKYMKDKMFAALRIPQGFLGFEESMPGALGSTTLTRLDIRYARMVKKIQKAGVLGIQRLMMVLWAYEKNKKPDPKKLRVQMEIISGVEEMDRMTGMERKMGVAQQAVGLVRDLEGSIYDPIPLYDYVFEDILGLKHLGLKFKKKPPEGEGEEESEGSLSSVRVSPDLTRLVEEIKETGKLDQGKMEQIVKLLDKGIQSKFPDLTECHRDSRAGLPKVSGETEDPEIELVQEDPVKEEKDESDTK